MDQEVLKINCVVLPLILEAYASHRFSEPIYIALV